MAETVEILDSIMGSNKTNGILKWLNDDDIKEWVMRLVVDKSRKKHIPSSRNCDWYRSIDMCIYDYDNKESALLDYNNQVSNMIKAREKYITDMLQKELSQFDKHFVKRVSYKKEYK